jgi:flagellar basal body rod protein FlgG
MVEDGRKQRLLTRNGQFMLDRAGNLILAGAHGEKVLDYKGYGIVLDGRYPVSISRDGVVSQQDEPVAQLGLFDVPDRSRLRKQGDTLLTYPDVKSLKQSASVTLRTGFIERANVDPARELAILMDAQRQLEANANMIRYQDQTLARLVNEVGKIG